jgi:hypothetical protein
LGFSERLLKLLGNPISTGRAVMYKIKIAISKELREVAATSIFETARFPREVTANHVCQFVERSFP